MPRRVPWISSFRKTVCRLVAGLVVSDDNLSPEEEAFVDRMIQRFAISDRDAIFPIVNRSEARDAMRALPEAVRREALALLVEAAAVDGKIVDEERAYLHAVCEASGLDEAAWKRKLEAALAAAPAGWGG